LNPSSTSNFAFFPLLHDAFILGGNNLSGTIPSELGLLTNLELINLCKYSRRVDLYLEEHGLNPSSTSNFAFFALLHDELILDNNQLSGSAPSELGLLTNVWFIDLCKYGRKVDLCLKEHFLNPSSTSNFAFFPLYYELMLGGNNLNGTIPLCKYSRKVDLCLEEHGLNPSSTSNFAFFALLHDELILGGGNLKGTISSELGLLTNVERIDLGK